MITILLLVALNIVLMVSGQTLWKLGLNKLGGFHLGNALEVLFSPYIISGLALYGLSTLLWLMILSRLPLSIAYPLQSLAYVLAVFAAFFIFHESIPPNRWIGTAIIITGIIVLSWK